MGASAGVLLAALGCAPAPLPPQPRTQPKPAAPAPAPKRAACRPALPTLQQIEKLLLTDMPPTRRQTKCPQPDEPDMAKEYTRIVTAMMKAPSACGPLDCPRQWNRFVDRLAAFYPQAPGPCASAPIQSPAYDAFYGLHRNHKWEFLDAYAAALEKSLESSCGEGAARTFESTWQVANRSKHMIILLGCRVMPFLVRFAPGSTTLDAKAIATVDRIAADMKIRCEKRMQIRGHYEKSEHNSALAKQRAKAVLARFVEDGIEKSRFELGDSGAKPVYKPPSSAVEVEMIDTTQLRKQLPSRSRQ